MKRRMFLAQLRKFPFSLLLIIILIAFVLRLYRISSPPLDWHSWRQADTASVTREFIKHGYPIWESHFHDVSNIPSGLNNLQGYRMVEFPLVNGLVALLVKYLGLPLIETSRMVSVLFSIGALISLFFLVEKVSGKKTAYLTAFIFAVLPYSMFYSRTILPEPAMLFFSTFSLMSFYYWLQSQDLRWYVSTFVAFAAALLLKPFVVFLLPVFAGLILLYELPISWSKRFVFEKLKYYFLMMAPAFMLSAAPFIAWRKWIEQFPEGIPANSWLFNGNGIRFRPAWFRWIFWERITKLMGGYVFAFFLPLNVLKANKEYLVYGSWWLGILIYLSVIATGNVQHDYYQVLVIPIFCVSVARGMLIVHEYLSQYLSKFVALAVLGGFVIVGWWFSWQLVGGYYNMNHTEYLIAGEAVNRLTPADALIIAPAFGDTQFLFQTNRRGWPIGFEIEDKIKLGADYYVSTSYDDEARSLEAQYELVEKNDVYILIDLQKKKVSE